MKPGVLNLRSNSLYLTRHQTMLLKWFLDEVVEKMFTHGIPEMLNSWLRQASIVGSLETFGETTEGRKK